MLGLIKGWLIFVPGNGRPDLLLRSDKNYSLVFEDTDRAGESLMNWLVF
jgi:hypothetical protein